MSQSNLWQKSSLRFDFQQVQKSLSSFKREDLADPIVVRNWVEFAKRFSQMQLTADDIQKLGFQSFHKLKMIMAVTLSNLSEETNQQNSKIQELQKEQRVLKRDLQNLKKIEQENKKKHQKLQRDMEQLQKKQIRSELNDSEYDRER